jgi:hypothetical protein
MPTDACQWFYECTNCHTLLKPLPGDCCVFCSYGDVPCPPIQLDRACCARSPHEGIAMKKLEVFDPAMCCSTGVCGVDVDPVLVQFAADLQWVAEQGVEVKRYNLGQEPQMFAENPAVLKEIQASLDRLPIISVDGQIVATGAYLSRAQLAQKMGFKLASQDKPHIRIGSACCNPKTGCC